MGPDAVTAQDASAVIALSFFVQSSFHALGAGIRSCSDPIHFLRNDTVMRLEYGKITTRRVPEYRFVSPSCPPQKS